MENVKEFIQAQIDRLNEIAENVPEDDDIKNLALSEAEMWQEALNEVEEYENSEPAWTDPSEIIAAACNSLTVVDMIAGSEESSSKLTKEQQQLAEDIKGSALGLCSYATDRLWKEMQDKLKWDKEQRAKKKTAAKKEGEK
jgi:hypothetical protein